MLLKMSFILLRSVNKSKSSRRLMVAGGLALRATAANIWTVSSGTVPLATRRWQCLINFDRSSHSGSVMCVCGNIMKDLFSSRSCRFVCGYSIVLHRHHKPTEPTFVLCVLSNALRMSSGWTEQRGFTSIIFRLISNWYLIAKSSFCKKDLKQPRFSTKTTQPRNTTPIPWSACTPLFHT